MSSAPLIRPQDRYRLGPMQPGAASAEETARLMAFSLRGDHDIGVGYDTLIPPVLGMGILAVVLILRIPLRRPRLRG